MSKSMNYHYRLISSVFGLLLFATSLKAGQTIIPADGVATVEVHQLDPKFPVDGFTGPNYKIHKYNEQLEENSDPGPEHRDQVFAASGLDSEVKDWDVPEKDVLYLQLRSLSIEKLKVIYPKLSEDRLKKGKEAVAGKK